MFLTMSTLFIIDGDLDLRKVRIFMQQVSLQVDHMWERSSVNFYGPTEWNHYRPSDGASAPIPSMPNPVVCDRSSAFDQLDCQFVLFTISGMHCKKKMYG